MKHITIEECQINMGAEQWIDGYNTACDLAEKEIQEATELANRSYNEGLMDGRLPIQGLEKEISELKQQLANCDNPSRVEPQPTIADLIKRVEKLEESAIMDGDVVESSDKDGYYAITKIK